MSNSVAWVQQEATEIGPERFDREQRRHGGVESHAGPHRGETVPAKDSGEHEAQSGPQNAQDAYPRAHQQAGTRETCAAQRRWALSVLRHREWFVEAFWLLNPIKCFGIIPDDENDRSL